MGFLDDLTEMSRSLDAWRRQRLASGLLTPTEDAEVRRRQDAYSKQAQIQRNREAAAARGQSANDVVAGLSGGRWADSFDEKVAGLDDRLGNVPSEWGSALPSTPAAAFGGFARVGPDLMQGVAVERAQGFPIVPHAARLAIPGGLGGLPAAREAEREIAGWMREHLGSGDPEQDPLYQAGALAKRGAEAWEQAHIPPEHAATFPVRAASTIGRAAPAMGAGLGLGILTANPYVAGGVAGGIGALQTLGASYEEARRNVPGVRGPLTPEEATRHAELQALIEGGAEMIGTGPLAKGAVAAARRVAPGAVSGLQRLAPQALSGGVGRVAARTAEQAAEEGLTQLAQGGEAEASGVIPPQTWGQRAGAAGEAAAIGGLMGGPVALGVEAANPRPLEVADARAKAQKAQQQGRDAAQAQAQQQAQEVEAAAQAEIQQAPEFWEEQVAALDDATLASAAANTPPDHPGRAALDAEVGRREQEQTQGVLSRWGDSTQRGALWDEVEGLRKQAEAKDPAAADKLLRLRGLEVAPGVTLGDWHSIEGAKRAESQKAVEGLQRKAQAAWKKDPAGFFESVLLSKQAVASGEATPEQARELETALSGRLSKESSATLESWWRLEAHERGIEIPQAPTPERAMPVASPEAGESIPPRSPESESVPAESPQGFEDRVRAAYAENPAALLEALDDAARQATQRGDEAARQWLDGLLGIELEPGLTVARWAQPGGDPSVYRPAVPPRLDQPPAIEPEEIQRPDAAPMPTWVREEMERSGLNPARIMNEPDATQYEALLAADPLVRRIAQSDPELALRALRGEASSSELRSFLVIQRPDAAPPPVPAEAPAPTPSTPSPEPPAVAVGAADIHAELDALDAQLDEAIERHLDEGMDNVAASEAADVVAISQRYNQLMEQLRSQHAEEVRADPRQVREGRGIEAGVPEEGGADLQQPEAPGPEAGDAQEQVAWGSRNRLVTQDAYLAAKEGLREAGRRLSAGLNPEDFANLVVVGLYHFEAGVREFAAWADGMAKRYGENLRPHFPEIWKAVQEQARERAEVPAGLPMPGDTFRVAHGLSGVRDARLVRYDKDAKGRKVAVYEYFSRSEQRWKEERRPVEWLPGSISEAAKAGPTLPAREDPEMARLGLPSVSVNPAVAPREPPNLPEGLDETPPPENFKDGPGKWRDWYYRLLEKFPHLVAQYGPAGQRIADHGLRATGAARALANRAEQAIKKAAAPYLKQLKKQHWTKTAGVVFERRDLVAEIRDAQARLASLSKQPDSERRRLEAWSARKDEDKARRFLQWLGFNPAETIPQEWQGVYDAFHQFDEAQHSTAELYGGDAIAPKLKTPHWPWLTSADSLREMEKAGSEEFRLMRERVADRLQAEAEEAKSPISRDVALERATGEIRGGALTNLQPYRARHGPFEMHRSHTLPFHMIEHGTHDLPYYFYRGEMTILAFKDFASLGKPGKDGKPTLETSPQSGMLSAANQIQDPGQRERALEYLRLLHGASFEDLGGNPEFGKLLRGLMAYEYASKLTTLKFLLTNIWQPLNGVFIFGPINTMRGVIVGLTAAGRDRAIRHGSTGSAHFFGGARHSTWDEAQLPRWSTRFLTSKLPNIVIGPTEMIVRSVADAAAHYAADQRLAAIRRRPKGFTAKVARGFLKKFAGLSDAEIDLAVEAGGFDLVPDPSLPPMPDGPATLRDKVNRNMSDAVNFGSGPNFQPQILAGTSAPVRLFRMLRGFAWNINRYVADVLTHAFNPKRPDFKVMGNILVGLGVPINIAGSFLYWLRDLERESDYEPEWTMRMLRRFSENLFILGFRGLLERPWDLVRTPLGTTQITFENVGRFVTEGVMRSLSTGPGSGHTQAGAALEAVQREIILFREAETFYKRAAAAFGEERPDFKRVRQVARFFADDSQSALQRLEAVKQAGAPSRLRSESISVVNAIEGGDPDKVSQAIHRYLSAHVARNPQNLDHPDARLEAALRSMDATVGARSPLGRISSPMDPEGMAKSRHLHEFKNWIEERQNIPHLVGKNLTWDQAFGAQRAFVEMYRAGTLEWWNLIEEPARAEAESLEGTGS